MKHIIIVIAIFAITATSCNNGNSASGNSNKKSETAPVNDSAVKVEASTQSQSKGTGSIKDIVIGYLQIKNALVNDDGNDAANAGKTLMVAVEKFNKSSLTPQQTKAFEDVSDDIKENAEHCSLNGNKIEHQRLHFEMLTQDIYDLLKTFGTGQTLYYDHCPMYNNNKGANWISETKEIKNPYLGRKMPACGSLKEEIK